MRHGKLLFVLVPLFLIVVGALVIKQIWFREDAKPVAMEDKAPVAKEDKAPAVDKADEAGPQGVGSIGKRGSTGDCQKELRRTADLLRFLQIESKWERKHNRSSLT